MAAKIKRDPLVKHVAQFVEMHTEEAERRYRDSTDPQGRAYYSGILSVLKDLGHFMDFDARERREYLRQGP